jgi:hypothetical protein
MRRFPDSKRNPFSSKEKENNNLIRSANKKKIIKRQVSLLTKIDLNVSYIFQEKSSFLFLF